jgi:glucose/arabinose dehydrogenase
VHVTAIKGLDHPWGIAFVPDGSMLVTERPGRLRVIRNGVVDPDADRPLPQVARDQPRRLSSTSPRSAVRDQPPHLPRLREAGLRRRQRRHHGGLSRALGRGSTLTEGKDIWVADAYHGAPAPKSFRASWARRPAATGTRFAWDPAGNLFVSLGDRNIGVKAQDPNSHIGKIVRITTDGGVPKDNPFVGRAGYKPEIWTLGHRNPLGLYVSPIDGSCGRRKKGRRAATS